MSGSRAITLSLSVQGADQLRRDLLAMGDVGEAALKKLDAAAMRAGQRGGSLSTVGTVTQDVTRSLEAMGSRLGPIGAGLTSLGVAGTAAAAALAGIGLAATGVARAGDEMTATLGRLASATGSVQAAADVYDRLYRISLQTGVSVAESAGAFQRFAIATREIGGTNEQALQLVATLQRAALVAGSSGQEASAAAGQLAQALASGVLQGDELRSILENMPNLAVALARELGVGVGELRKMGSEGQLTADRVLPALLRAGEQINREFEKLPPTMDRAFSTLGTAMTRFAADLDRALGLSESIARAVLSAANAVDRTRLRAGFASPMEAEVAASDASRARIANLRAQIELFEPGLRNPVRGGVLRPGQVATAAEQNGADRLAELRRALEAEEAVLRQHRENISAIEFDAQFERSAEETRAAAARLRGQQTALDSGLAALRAAYDQESTIRATHARAVAAIDEQLARGAIDGAEASRLRTAADREQTEALQRLAGAAREVAQAYGQISTNATGLLSLGAADDRAITEIQRNIRGTALDPAVARREAEQRAQMMRREAEANDRRLEASVQFWGTSLADATFDGLRAGFERGENVAEVFARSFGNVLMRAASNALADTVFTPMVREAFGAVGYTGAASGAGSMGSLLGLGSLFGGGGISGAINGLGVSSGLFGNGVTFAANSGAASYGGFGLAGEGATAGLLGSGTAMQFLGGIGGGFALGSMLANLTATSPNRQTNGMIGAGAGALLGVGLAGATGGLSLLAGGLLGGAGGGLLGGLIGPGKGFEGGDALLSIDANGRVVVSRYAGKGESGEAQAAIMANAQQQANALNAQLAATGLRFRDATAEGGFAAALGSGQSDNPRDIATALERFNLGPGSLTSANDNVLRAIGNTSSLSGAVEAAAWVTSVYDALSSTAEPATAFDAAMKAINDKFEVATAEAQRLGLATDNLTANQRKQQQELRDQQAAQINAVQGSITSRYYRAVGMETEAAINDFDLAAIEQVKSLRETLTQLGASAEDTATQIDRLQGVQALERANILRRGAETGATAGTSRSDSTARGLFEDLSFGSLSSLSPAAQAAAARASITAAGRAFGDGATEAEIAEYARVVQAALPVVQQIEGISGGYASLVNDVNSTLRRAAPGADAANLSTLIDATTSVEAAIYATDPRGVIGDLKAEIARLNAMMAAMAARLPMAA